MAATLNARPRSDRGKGAARKMRRSGVIPAVVYGHGEQTQALSVDAHELQRLIATISVENTIIDLTIEGQGTTPALIREVQWHPSRPVLLHLDLLQIHAGETLQLEVPLRLTGSPIGVREQGGVLQQSFHELEIECLPRNIPEVVEVDVSGLGVGDSIHVRDVKIADTTILNDGDLTICSVITPSVAALPVAPETEDGIGGDVEPGLLRDREADAEDVDFEHGSEQPE